MAQIHLIIKGCRHTIDTDEVGYAADVKREEGESTAIKVPMLSLTLLNEEWTDADLERMNIPRTKTFDLSQMPPAEFMVSGDFVRQIQVAAHSGEVGCSLESIASAIKQGHGTYGSLCTHAWFARAPFPAQGLAFISRLIDGALDSHASEFQVEFRGVF